MALSEIEKLERRYAENPQGLTFAPLAEVHRKNGDVARALELLRPGLQQHPNYVPASIVLGRCHLDLGDLASAETAFAHVLSLDNENVIALKALADIGERQHHFDAAEAYLQTLLDVDRSNDEARAQLERLGAARAVEARAGSQPEEPVPEALGGSGGAPTAEEAPAEPVFEPIAEPVAGSVEPSGLPLGYDDLEYSSLDAGRDEPPAPGLEEVEETTQLDEPVEPIAGLVGREEADAGGEEFDFETQEDIVLQSAGASEFQMPDAGQELIAQPPPYRPEQSEDRGDLLEAEPRAQAEQSEDRGADFSEEPRAEAEQSAAAEPRVEADYFAEPEPEPERSFEPPPVVEPEPAPRWEAERQWQPEPRWQPEPEWRPEPAPPIDPGPPPEPVPETHAAEPPRHAATAGETGGESVRNFFGRMLSARLPGAAAAPPAHAPTPTAGTDAGDAGESGGAPTRPAADALSLSSVFGEDSAPLPPAVPASGAPAGVSFDEFYSPPGAASGSRPKGAEAKNDDLDQFHAWLQNLKR